QARSGRRPMRRVDHDAGGRQALCRGKLADGARDALGHGVVVGAQDDHALGVAQFPTFQSRSRGLRQCLHPSRRSPAVAELARGASRSMPSSSEIRNSGRPLISSYMRPRYSPMTPSEISCTPAKNITEMTSVGKPGTSVPYSSVFTRKTMA